MAPTKTIGEQMAALNTSDDTSFADRSNSLLNATCPARIQNNSSANLSFAAPSAADTSMTSSVGKWRPKREPLKITPLEQIDENTPARKYVPAASSIDKRPSDYKTRLCDSYRRSGWCPYNTNCTYAHGDKELQIPKRRLPLEYTTSSLSTSSKHRDSRDSRDNYRRHSRERRNSSKRGGDEFEISFRGGGGGASSGSTSTSRYRSNDDSSRYGNDRCCSSSSNNHYNSNNSHHHHHSHRPICHAFQRGNCRYGPRCRYLHQEQLPQFNGNATMYACPPSDSIYYHAHHQNTHTYLMPYFIPQQGAPPPQQYVDLNQSMQTIQYLPPQAPPTYFVPPPQQVALDQSIVYAPPTDQVYSQPPPPPQPLMS
ncbi:Protein CBR-PIE-1 [Caenorhabditis briggsae]|uniref:Protein CBR-PIE-1 n=1 Tax=Caenorhabditis briggsae TaxID=6238 RepID=A8XDT1_CAEBR|nr:Protein CBR-PIE-1 [Caenorhabditis briggsae]CAP30826.2 Protein CBR-PIE-1 [Caenorhabditis briggsae]